MTMLETGVDKNSTLCTDPGKIWLSGNILAVEAVAGADSVHELAHGQFRARAG